MDTSKIDLMLEVLVELKSYTVKSVRSGNTMWSSEPSENAETTYENLKKSIPTLEKNVFYKILSMFLNRKINDEASISKHDITMLITGNHDDNSNFNIHKRIEILKMLNLVTEL